jgi:hypothetical protein
MFQTRRCFIATALQLCFRICHSKASAKPGRHEIVSHQFLVYTDDVNIFGGCIHIANKNREASVVTSKETGGLQTFLQ